MSFKCFEGKFIEQVGGIWDPELKRKAADSSRFITDILYFWMSVFSKRMSPIMELLVISLASELLL